MRYLTLEELEKKYIVGRIEQFDQKNDMYRRSRWQPEARGLWAKLWEESPPQNKPGYTLKDRALENALWYIEPEFCVKISFLTPSSIFNAKYFLHGSLESFMPIDWTI